MTAENNATDESHWQRIGYSISRVKAHRAIGSGKTGVEITRERGPIRFQLIKSDSHAQDIRLTNRIPQVSIRIRLSVYFTLKWQPNADGNETNGRECRGDAAKSLNSSRIREPFSQSRPALIPKLTEDRLRRRNEPLSSYTRLDLVSYDFFFLLFFLEIETRNTAPK